MAGFLIRLYKDLIRSSCLILNSRNAIYSVYLLHLRGLIGSTFNLLEWWQVIVVTKALIIIVDAEAQFDHAMNTTCELCRLIKVEARCKQRRVEEKPNQILHGLVRLVSCCLFPQFSHNGVFGVDLHGLLGDHV